MPRLRRLALTLLAFGAALAIPGAVRAQDGAAARLRVFLDCRTGGCDRNFFITEMPYVIWTQDRLDADVHVLITALGTGAGGTEYTLALLGQRAFVGRGDTLVTATPPNTTDDARRREIARVLRLALVPYLLRSPGAANFDLRQIVVDEAPPRLETIDDPWNFWIYRVSASGDADAESRSEEHQLEGSLSASRVTERTKLVFDLDYEYEASQFTLSSGEIRTFILREYDLDARWVQSLTDHWSFGTAGSVGMSEFGNRDLAAELDFGLEYNLFPWQEATSRQLVAIASLGGRYFDYDEVTIFGRTSETRPVANLILAGETRQAWGSADGSIRHTRYLHDLNVFSVRGNIGASIRLTRGLALDLGAYGEKVKDQLFLPRGDASDEEVLTRQRALGTAYRYGVSIGVSFTFGSIYNTIVNPRLDRAN
jgi:hypothetical protein